MNLTRLTAAICAAVLACGSIPVSAESLPRVNRTPVAAFGEEDDPDEDGVLVYYTPGSGELPADLEIPSVLNGEPVFGIAENGFSSHQELVSVSFPGSVVLIGRNAFGNCGNLKTLNFSEGLVGIDDRAFTDCTIETVTLPESLTNIGHYAFWDCKKLKSVHLPDNLQKLGRNAFDGCTALTEINIPATLETINVQTFIHCTALESVTIPETVNRIEELAFAGCTSLKTVTILNPECSFGSSRTTFCNEVSEDNRKGVYHGVIRGYVGSTAERLALDCGCTFEPLDPEHVTTTAPPEHVWNGFVYDKNFMGVTIEGYVGEVPETLEIPETIEGIPVGAVNGAPFRKSKTLKHLTVPKTVKEAYIGILPALESVTFLNPDIDLPMNADALCNGIDAFDPYYNGVIRGYAGSKAQQFAEKNGYRFEEIKPEQTTVTTTVPVKTTTTTTVTTVSGSGTTSDGTTPVTTTTTSVFGKDGKALHEGIYYQNMGDYAAVVGYINTQMTIKSEIVDRIGGLPVRVVASRAFDGLQGVDSIVIPESVKTLENEAFYNCKDLHFVTIYNPQINLTPEPTLFTNSEGEDFIGVLYSYKGSNTEGYASYHKRFFSALDELPGDVILDGKVSIEDAQEALKAYTEQVAGNSSGLNDVQIRHADINKDNTVGVEDAQLILKYYTEKYVAGRDVTWEALLK